MSKKRIFILLMCVLVVSAMVLSGCKEEAKETPVVKKATEKPAEPAKEKAKEEVVEEPVEKGKLTMMYWLGEEDPYYGKSLELIEEFNLRDDVTSTFEFSYATGTTYYTKLNAAIAANDAPDVFACHAAGKLQTYVDAGKVYALDEALEQDQEWKDRFIGGIFSLMQFDGKTYAIPTSQAAVPLFYNKDIFAQYGLEPATNYDELKNIIAVLNENGVTPFAFGAKDAWTSALFSELVANRIGGNDPYNAVVDATGSWEDPSFVKAGEILSELVELNAFPEDFLGVDYGGMNALMKSGEAAMLVMGSWAISGFYEEDSLVSGKIGIANFPALPDGKGSNKVWLGQPDANLCISEACEDKDSAIAFVKMWASEETQKFVGEDAGKIIVTNTTLDTEKVYPLNNELISMMSDMEEMFIFYDVGLGAVIGDEYNNTIQAILAGKDSAEAFADLETYTQQNR